MQMIKFIFHIILVFNFFYSCDEGARQSYIPNLSREKTKYQISDKLNKEIREFISVYDSLSMERKVLKTNIFVVCFFHENESDFFVIRNAIGYNSKIMDGYFMFDKNAVVFYDIDSISTVGLVEDNMPKENIPAKFMDKASSDANVFPYSSYGWTFRVHNKDSLELYTKHILCCCELNHLRPPIPQE